MASTNSRELIDRIIEGEFDFERPLVVKVVEYTNAWGVKTWGTVTEIDHPDRYAASGYVIDPKVIWERPADESLEPLA